MRTKVNRQNRLGDFRVPLPGARCMSLFYPQCRTALTAPCRPPAFCNPSCGGATFATHSKCRALNALTRRRDIQAASVGNAVMSSGVPSLPKSCLPIKGLILPEVRTLRRHGVASVCIWRPMRHRPAPPRDRTTTLRPARPRNKRQKKKALRRTGSPRARRARCCREWCRTASS